MKIRRLSKSVLTLILAGITVLQLGCGEEAVSEGTTSAQDSSEDFEANTEAEIYSTLPDKTYDGRE